MSDWEVASRADAILGAFASQRLIPPISDLDPAFHEDAAYGIAREIHAGRVSRGERPIGRKIGFTNRAFWSENQMPFWSYIYDSTVLHVPGGMAGVPLGGLLQPRIEPEIQVHFARQPPVTTDEEAILDCIDWIAHGFEFVQCPYPEWRLTSADAIAAAGVHGVLLVGTPVLVADIDDCAEKLGSFTIRLLRSGVEESAGGGANVVGSPLLACAYLAEILSEQSPSEPVQAGEIVTTGTLTAAPFVSVGETWSTTIEGIELPGLMVTIA
jgi:2-oxo-3-hexenedioate decarboxylase